jgi:uncharacterized protein YegJ (DUF2314 family)
MSCFVGLTSRRSQPPLPLRLQSTPRVGGGSAFCVRRLMPMPDSTPSKFTQEQKEPLFTAISGSDASFQDAYAQASQTLPRFITHIQSGMRGYFSAKLRFRDPDESERLGEDRFLFLWLTGVHYHPAEECDFSGSFFEVPRELQKWHQVGQRLAFQGEDIFDWMALNEDGRLFGGYTLRVSRSKLPESERADYDRHIGVTAYEPDA